MVGMAAVSVSVFNFDRAVFLCGFCGGLHGACSVKLRWRWDRETEFFDKTRFLNQFLKGSR
jgi:hypothetical protein